MLRSVQLHSATKNNYLYYMHNAHHLDPVIDMHVNAQVLK